MITTKCSCGHAKSNHVNGMDRCLYQDKCRCTGFVKASPKSKALPRFPKSKHRQLSARVGDDLWG